MDILIQNLGDLKLYQSRIMQILIIGIVIEIIFLLLLKTRYTKYTTKPFRTILCGLFFSFFIVVVRTRALYGRTPGTEFILRFQLFGSYIEAFREDKCRSPASDYYECCNICSDRSVPAKLL